MSTPRDRKRTRPGPGSPALVLLAVLLAGCAASPSSAPGHPDRAALAGSRPAAQRGQVPVTVTADRGALRDGIVSLGAPFPRGFLKYMGYRAEGRSPQPC
ncbi:hypothetical protein [Sorangium sp. So ce887]|uniref:hypothetical protein n=1 Tax=Sorangium sp. So ce887 TaxID=3133324 RepID=UPI003F63B9ED